MSGAPRVSVVLPVRDGARWIAESVESVLAQTLRELELIVVDDGSTDATPEIVAGLAARDARVRPVGQPGSLGLVAALNRGIEAARAPLVARHDADDVARPERLARQVEVLDRRPEVGVVGAAYHRLYDDGRLALRRPPAGDTEIRWRMLFGNVWPHPSVVFRRALVPPGEPVYSDLPLCEDYELWLRLLDRSQGVTVGEPLLVVRTHEAVGVSAPRREAQRRAVAELSAARIGALLGEEVPTGAVEAMRHCRRATRLDPAATREVPRLLRLWDVFARAPFVDRAEAARLRRAWLRRLVGALPVAMLPALAGSGPLAELRRREPGEVARALLVAWPRHRMARFVRSRT